MTIILVVDDSAVDRQLVGGLLSKVPNRTIEYACDGVEAMTQMKDHVPDLIVTDLTMPRMDGLDLVTAMRISHPNVPVILMTAYGSESLAVEALAKGAASYVPKSQLSKKLADTVDDILARAKADRNYEKLISCLNKPEFTFFLELENDPALIDPLVDLVQQLVARTKLCDFTGQLRVGVAVREALFNALLHGNLELTPDEAVAVREELLKNPTVVLLEQRKRQSQYGDRRILVDVRVSAEEARFVIHDEGPGFDVSSVPDLTQPGALEPEEGRGLSLMRTFMDEVRFNDSGNQVTMVKRREKSVKGLPSRE